jgi:hypothetical protein
VLENRPQESAQAVYSTHATLSKLLRGRTFAAAGARPVESPLREGPPPCPGLRRTCAIVAVAILLSATSYARAASPPLSDLDAASLIESWFAGSGWTESVRTGTLVVTRESPACAGNEFEHGRISEAEFKSVLAWAAADQPQGNGHRRSAAFVRATDQHGVCAACTETPCRDADGRGHCS